MTYSKNEGADDAIYISCFVMSYAVTVLSQQLYN